MPGCKRCGQCCRWLTFPPERYDHDEEAVEAFGGMAREGFFMRPCPCPQLKENDCTIYERRPKYCQDFPDENGPWLKALGCKYYDED